MHDRRRTRQRDEAIDDSAADAVAAGGGGLWSVVVVVVCAGCLLWLIELYPPVDVPSLPAAVDLFLMSFCKRTMGDSLSAADAATGLGSRLGSLGSLGSAAAYTPRGSPRSLGTRSTSLGFECATGGTRAASVNEHEQSQQYRAVDLPPKRLRDEIREIVRDDIPVLVLVPHIESRTHEQLAGPSRASKALLLCCSEPHACSIRCAGSARRGAGEPQDAETASAIARVLF